MWRIGAVRRPVLRAPPQPDPSQERRRTPTARLVLFGRCRRPRLTKARAESRSAPPGPGETAGPTRQPHHRSARTGKQGPCPTTGRPPRQQRGPDEGCRERPRPGPDGAHQLPWTRAAPQYRSGREAKQAPPALPTSPGNDKGPGGVSAQSPPGPGAPTWRWPRAHAAGSIETGGKRVKPLPCSARNRTSYLSTHMPRTRPGASGVPIAAEKKTTNLVRGPGTRDHSLTVPVDILPVRDPADDHPGCYSRACHTDSFQSASK